MREEDVGIIIDDEVDALLPHLRYASLTSLLVNQLRRDLGGDMAALWPPSSKSGEMGFSPTSSYSLHEMCIRTAIIRPSLICQVSKIAQSHAERTSVDLRRSLTSDGQRIQQLMALEPEGK